MSWLKNTNFVLTPRGRSILVKTWIWGESFCLKNTFVLTPRGLSILGKVRERGRVCVCVWPQNAYIIHVIHERNFVIGRAFFFFFFWANTAPRLRFSPISAPLLLFPMHPFQVFTWRGSHFCLRRLFRFSPQPGFCFLTPSIFFFLLGPQSVSYFTRTVDVQHVLHPFFFFFGSFFIELFC
jgi:hypothetical protein